MTDILRHTDLKRPQPIRTPRPFVRPVPLRDPGPGCVLYLAWDNPGAGGVWKDRSGKGNHGTINGATWSDTPWGRGLLFDGVDDYVDCGNDASLDVTAPMSAEVWAYPTQAKKADIVSRWGAGGVGMASWAMQMNSSLTVTFWVYNGATASYVTSTVQVTLNKWNHIITVHTGTVFEVHINLIKRKAGTSIIPQVSTAYNLNVGREPADVDYFNGSIALVRIYNRALSAAEIAQHYWEETPYA